MKCYTSFRNFRFHFLFNPILFRAYKSFLIQSRVYEFSFLYFLITIFHFPFYTSFRTFGSFFFFSFNSILPQVYTNRSSFDQNFIFKFSSLFFSSFSDKIFFNPYEILYYNSFKTFISILFFSFPPSFCYCITRSKIVLSFNNLYNLSLILCIKSLQITHLLFLSLVIHFFWLSFRPISIVSIILFSRIMIRVQIWMYPDKIFQVKAPSTRNAMAGMQRIVRL